MAEDKGLTFAGYLTPVHVYLQILENLGVQIKQCRSFAYFIWTNFLYKVMMYKF